MVCLPWKEGKAAGFICGPRSTGPTCRFCGQPANKRCDWDLDERGTCSSWICDKHAESIHDDVNLCPNHTRLFYDGKHEGAIIATLLRGQARKAKAAARTRRRALHQAQGNLFGGTDA